MKEGWSQEPLRNVCTLISGQHIDSKNYNTEKRGIGYLTGPSDFGDVYPIISKWTEHPKVVARDGDILITVKGSGVGKINLLDQDTIAISRQLMAVRVTKAVPRFIYAVLGSVFDHFQTVSTGAAIPGISRDQVLGLEFALPPPSEQQRIVAVLDEAFEGIATAKANAEKNLQNARELFASRMQVLFGQDEAWERVHLEELLARGWITSHLDGNHGSDYPRKEEFVDAGVPYIAASAIKGGAVNFHEAKYLSPQRAATIRKGLAKDRDVLFAHNATVGPVAILSTDEDSVILGTSLTYYRCDPQHIHPEYLAHFMVSPAFTSQYTQVMKQSTRNQVPITKQREFFHVIPPIEVQRQIANDLEKLSTQTNRLADIDARKLAALEELKNSLLHHALDGQL